MGLATAVVLLVLASAGLVIHAGVKDSSHKEADEQALMAVDLLASIGTRLPDLSPSTFLRGLSPQRRRRLDAALAQGREDGIVANLALYAPSGRLLYEYDAARSPGSMLRRTALEAALAGRATTRRLGAAEEGNALEVPALAAVEPLRRNSKTYGVMEIWRPLAPVLAQARAEERRILWTLVVGGLALWLAATPFLLRPARAMAEQWAPGRRRLLKAFARSLDHDEIVVLFQPQVALATGAPVGAEALVRWRRGGVLCSPAEFLSTIEGTNLMPALTDRVLELALTELATLSDAEPELRMSVNCSADDLADAAFPGRVRSALESSGVPGSRLTLEVTETAVISDLDMASTMLQRLSELGVDVAVDDFGTGHSSISRLHALPVDELKIDRSFMGADERSRNYVTALVGFAHGLGLRVVAEGVEDEATMMFLGTLGCEVAQGYYCAKPLASDDLAAWLEATRPSRRRAGAPKPEVPLAGLPVSAR